MMSEHHKVMVWDLPTRLFHWGLALAVTALVATGKAGEDWVTWHARLGYVAGSLVVFRIVWGFAGGHWSRFTTFPPSPKAALNDLRQGPSGETLGHSPAGALSVYAMLTFLALQVATGLASANKDDFAGPLAQFVPNEMVRACSQYHRNVGEWIVIALVVLHVAAVAYYRWALRRNLVAAMVHGYQQAAPGSLGSRDDMRMRVLALVVLAACAALFGWVASLA